MQQKESLKWELNKNNDSITLQLVGELTRDTLLPLWQQCSSFLSLPELAQQKFLIDLDKISRIDSAGFALICELVEKMNGKAKSVRLTDYPTQLITLADLFGLTNWVKPFL